MSSSGAIILSSLHLVILSRFFRSHLVHRGLDAGQLGDAILLIDAIEPDAGKMLSQEDARTHQQVVEMLVDQAPQQMFAEVGNFRVLVDDQRAAGLEYAAADRFPVVGENAA